MFGRLKRFTTSGEYWQQRYASGRDSGAGSYGRLAAFKAETLNQFVADHGIVSVLEFGCGDGNQLTLARYPQYTGLDVSSAAIQRCADRFAHDPTKSFYCYTPHAWIDRARRFHADLTLSLDVIYHLVEDDVYLRYMADLFAAADQYVIVYSTNLDRRDAAHVRHRPILAWWASQRGHRFRLLTQIPNRYPPDGTPDSSAAEFFIFERFA